MSEVSDYAAVVGGLDKDVFLCLNLTDAEKRTGKLTLSSTQPAPGDGVALLLPKGKKGVLRLTTNPATGGREIDLVILTVDPPGDPVEPEEMCLGNCPPFQRVCPPGKTPACGNPGSQLECV